MKKSKKYWIKRTLQSEERAFLEGKKLSKRYESMYVRSYNRVNRELERLAAKASVSINDLTNTEVYDYGRMINLREIIEKEFLNTTITMQTQAEKTLLRVYNGTLKQTAKDFDLSFIRPNEFQAKAVVNEVYKGSNYSERIWKNNNELATRIQADMERMIMQGRSPSTISKQLQTDFNTGYSNANRLVRTEASRVYNTAKEESYRQFGIDQVEFLAESGACHVCGEHNGQTYSTSVAPSVPVHPNCRCVYLPVVPDLEEE